MHRSTSDYHVEDLAIMATEIEKHCDSLMDIEWADDDDEFYVVQPCLETEASKEKVGIIEDYKMDILKYIDETELFKTSDVFIADRTASDWEPPTKRASGIVMNRDGRTCHNDGGEEAAGNACVTPHGATFTNSWRSTPRDSQGLISGSPHEEKDVQIRKRKILKKPLFDFTTHMNMHGEVDDMTAEMMANERGKLLRRELVEKLGIAESVSTEIEKQVQVILTMVCSCGSSS